MKKNYFYATVAEEFALLSRACACGEQVDRSDLLRVAKQRHFALCRRLIGDFVAPAERVDILAISEGICRALEALCRADCTPSDLRRMGDCAALLGATPFAFDVSAVARREEFLALQNQPSSRDSAAVFSALDQLSRDLLKAAVRNA